MEDIIRDIQDKIRQNRFPNEASISQGIILRILRVLGWNVDDIDIVWPEFTLGSQRADYALCYPGGKPRVLLEVKQPGTMGASAEEQLASYAYKEGVPLVVLTSGQDWHFYAPYGPGQFSDRRIYRLDLMERTPQEAAGRFERYLAFSAWQSGVASQRVQEDLTLTLGIQETRRRLPEAWAALLSDPSSELVELLSTQVEKQTGSEPSRSEIVSFLRDRVAQPVTRSEPPSIRQPSPTPSRTPVTRPTEVRSYGEHPLLWINGQEITVRNHRDRFIQVMRYLLQRDPTFPAKFVAKQSPGRRPTFAQTVTDLFPKAVHLADSKSAWDTLGGSPLWYIDVNKSAGNMSTLIREACEIAGVPFGDEIRIKN